MNKLQKIMQTKISGKPNDGRALSTLETVSSAAKWLRKNKENYEPKN